VDEKERVIDPAREIIADWPTMDELQRRYFQLALSRNGGNRSRTAAALGLDRRTVQRMLAKYQLASTDDEVIIEKEGENKRDYEINENNELDEKNW
jgi:DNA-binding NtrC family response regulator